MDAAATFVSLSPAKIAAAFTGQLFSSFLLDDVGLPPWVLPPHVDNPVGLSLMPCCLGQHWLSGTDQLLQLVLSSQLHVHDPLQL
jgi:hypothetical protein